MSNNNPNLDDQKPQDGVDPNLGGGDNEPGGADRPNNDPDHDPEHGIDYKKKFSESTTENQRIRAENERIAAENARLMRELGDRTPSDDRDPGADPDGEDENVVAFTDHVVQKAKSELEKDPAIALARRTYNEKTFDDALSSVIEQHPELATTKSEFKEKYFQANNVPANIKDLLGDLAKIWLFDKAKQMGAEEERAKQNRLDTERITGGDRTQRTKRTLEEWHRIAQANPAKFATMKKEYEADLASGELVE